MDYRPVSEPRTDPDGVALPWPDDEPVIRLWPTVGQTLKLGRSATFEANRRGELPFDVWRIGGRDVCPTSGVRAALGLPLNRPDND
jgi:hypothetical protein